MIEERQEEYKVHALFGRLKKFSEEKKLTDAERSVDNPYAAQV